MPLLDFTVTQQLVGYQSYFASQKTCAIASTQVVNLQLPTANILRHCVHLLIQLLTVCNILFQNWERM
ncbi:hypothetical protein [Chroococcidiopsis sp. SAG 2025]|uniref:hypothetical protein n=1 Tax=Chroococcidiopsis sp. SAG 2025 TaxID=171389 RepID=UPI002936D8C8|nr:hypothetical protein [Chroococcidiopsis sp. SAG 2025]